MSALSTLFDSLSKDESFATSGLSGPAAARLLTLLAEKADRPLLVLFPSDSAIQTLLKDLEPLSLLSQDVSIQILHFPYWGASLRRKISPSIEVRQKRIRTLSLLASQSFQKKIILTTPAAASLVTLPHKELLGRAPVLSKTSRAELLRLLPLLGYLRVDTVEEPGTFASRGDLLDLFSPADPDPIRIEYFGEDFERLRYFNPESQKTISHPRLALPTHAYPARELLLDESTTKRIRARAREKAEELELDRRKTDPILGPLAAGKYLDHSEAWCAWAYEERNCLFDYGPFLQIHFDKEAIEAAQKELWAEEQKLESAARTAGEGFLLLPSTEEFFFPRPFSATPFLKIEPFELISEKTKFIQLSVETLKRDFELNQTQLRAHLPQGTRRIVYCESPSTITRIEHWCHSKKITGVETVLTQLDSGYFWPELGEWVLPAKHLLESRLESKNERPRKTTWSGLQALADLQTGDHVVHRDHGISKYAGVQRIGVRGEESDYLQLEYAQGDRLFLPVYRLHLIQKHSDATAHVALDRLGSPGFAKAKERAQEAAQKLAVNLLDLYAQRKLSAATPLVPTPDLYLRFENSFPYEETPDQARAIDDVFSDLASGHAMDRLICGDVGFGKTEVAMRAAFAAVSAGKQVAVLVPTTILAAQHEQTFINRFSEFPVHIASLSRFKSGSEQKRTLAALQEGKVDVLIGTHRLLSKDCKFRNLGLLIVDEEHRFGVEHKELLKNFQPSCHVLTLSATPIPRTLHFSLSGIRDISLISTAPTSRSPVKTYISPYDENIITSAIENELSRGGQVYFLRNRVQGIESAREKLARLVPAARIGVAHGQLSESALEATMRSFYTKEIDVLLCTSIIESGLDVPQANTLLVERADSLGLAQLYQIRGRVGRGQERAYAYLFLPEEAQVTEDAKKRLDVIQRFVELGSGFNIASHDLEIRGGGDLLGPNQSGHIAAVGFDLYLELLEEATRRLRSESPSGEPLALPDPEIKISAAAYLDEKYVPDVHQRMALYRRLSSAPDEASLAELENELVDRFGPIPEPALNLVWIIRLRHLLSHWGLTSLSASPDKLTLQASSRSSARPEKLLAIVASDPRLLQLLPDSRLVLTLRPWKSLSELFFQLEEFLERVR